MQLGGKVQQQCKGEIITIHYSEILFRRGLLWQIYLQVFAAWRESPKSSWLEGRLVISSLGWFAIKLWMLGPSSALRRSDSLSLNSRPGGRWSRPSDHFGLAPIQPVGPPLLPCNYIIQWSASLKLDKINMEVGFMFYIADQVHTQTAEDVNVPSVQERREV